jgi:methionyl aminopeptidase
MVLVKSVVRDFCGHGIGKEFHTVPQILHYKNNDSSLMKEGMIFTIEPMINERGHKVKLLEDGWTAITRDGGYSAQYEHTILVTKNGCEVLTG